MIKLIDLLKEIEAASNEQEIIDDLLGTLNEGAFDDLLAKAKEYAKKGLLTAGVLAALMASPQLSSAQKAQIKDIAKTTTSTPEITKKYRDTTAIDGIIGSVTSKFIFPETILKSKQYLNDILVRSSEEAFKAGHGPALINKANKFQLSPDQMVEWNDFVGWMKKQGYSGDTALDRGRLDLKILDEYRKIKPDFWIKGDDDVKKVQETLKAYRALWMQSWLAGIETAKKQGLLLVQVKDRNPQNPDDIQYVDSVFMPWAK